MQHIDLWVLYLMYFRPNNADWVAVSPFFNTMILRREMPLYYADGVTYGVPWFSQSVKKVRHSICHCYSLEVCPEFVAMVNDWYVVSHIVGLFPGQRNRSSLVFSRA